MKTKVKALLITFLIFAAIGSCYLFWNDIIMYTLIGLYSGTVAFLIFAITYNCVKQALDKGSK